MTTVNLIGWGIILSIFVAIFLTMVKIEGLKVTLIIWVMALTVTTALTAWVYA